MLTTRKLSEISWDCVHFSDSDALPDLEGLISTGFKVFEVDAKHISTKEQLLTSIARAMEFPEYFGRNWDALDECLRDMGWSPASGYLLTVRHAKSLWRRNPKVAAELLQSWVFSAEEWSRQGVPFHLIFAW